ncbi:chemotactic signal-response protein CheL [compost metagenome]
MFLNTLTKELFSSIKTDESVMGGGFGEETWRSMQSEQLAANMAQNGGLGIAEQLLPDLLAMQEAANNVRPCKPFAIAVAEKHLSPAHRKWRRSDLRLT